MHLRVSSQDAAESVVALSRLRGRAEAAHRVLTHAGRGRSRPAQETPVRIPDRRTARDRIRLTTTGLAVGGVVGVAGVTGGLAITAHGATSAASPDVSSTSSTATTSSTPRVGTDAASRAKPRHQRVAGGSRLSNGPGKGISTVTADSPSGQGASTRRCVRPEYGARSRTNP